MFYFSVNTILPSLPPLTLWSCPLLSRFIRNFYFYVDTFSPSPLSQTFWSYPLISSPQFARGVTFLLDTYPFNHTFSLPFPVCQGCFTSFDRPSSHPFNLYFGLTLSSPFPFHPSLAFVVVVSNNRPLALPPPNTTNVLHLFTNF